MATEWCVMHPDFAEPHRGPMSEEVARNWVREVEERGVKRGGFFVARREVGPWIPDDGETTDDSAGRTSDSDARSTTRP